MKIGPNGQAIVRRYVALATLRRRQGRAVEAAWLLTHAGEVRRMAIGWNQFMDQIFERYR